MSQEAWACASFHTIKPQAPGRHRRNKDDRQKDAVARMPMLQHHRLQSVALPLLTQELQAPWVAQLTTISKVVRPFITCSSA